MLVVPRIVIAPGDDPEPYRFRARQYLEILRHAYGEWTGLDLEVSPIIVYERDATWPHDRSAALGFLRRELGIRRRTGEVDVIWAHGVEAGGAGSYGIALLWLAHLTDRDTSTRGNAFWLAHEFLHARGLTHAGNPYDAGLMRQTDTAYRWREFAAYGPRLLAWERDKLIAAHEDHAGVGETVPTYEFIDLTDKFTQSLFRAEHTKTAIHHTTGEAMNTIVSPSPERSFLNGIDRYHRNERGWPTGIGYHDVAFVSGRVYRVGEPDTQRTHVAGCNDIYHGIALAGNWETAEPPDYMYEILAQHIIAQKLPRNLERHGAITGSVCPGLVDVDAIKEAIAALTGPAQPDLRPMEMADLADIGQVILGVTPSRPTTVKPTEPARDGWDAWYVERRR